jgi:hypothetical protein
MTAEQIRAALCAKYPEEFEHGYQFGLTGNPPLPCDAAGYPIGFRAWPLERCNAWWAGWNLGNVQRGAGRG